MANSCCPPLSGPLRAEFAGPRHNHLALSPPEIGATRLTVCRLRGLRPMVGQHRASSIGDWSWRSLSPTSALMCKGDDRGGCPASRWAKGQHHHRPAHLVLEDCIAAEAATARRDHPEAHIAAALSDWFLAPVVRRCRRYSAWHWWRRRRWPPNSATSPLLPIQRSCGLSRARPRAVRELCLGPY
jgi:hypothetical protein